MIFNIPVLDITEIKKIWSGKAEKGVIQDCDPTGYDFLICNFCNNSSSKTILDSVILSTEITGADSRGATASYLSPQNSYDKIEFWLYQRDVSYKNQSQSTEYDDFVIEVKDLYLSKINAFYPPVIPSTGKTLFLCEIYGVKCIK